MYRNINKNIIKDLTEYLGSKWHLRLEGLPGHVGRTRGVTSTSLLLMFIIFVSLFRTVLYKSTIGKSMQIHETKKPLYKPTRVTKLIGT